MAIVAAPALVAPLVLCTTNSNMALCTDNGNHKSSPTHSGLVRVDSQAPATQGSAAQAPASFDAESWKTSLSQRDLEAREHAFERLIDEARGNDAARKQLEAWSQDDSDFDLAWTSRMALRELRVQSGSSAWSAPRRARLGGAQPWDDLRSRMDDLQSQFGGLDSMFEDMQREMDQAFQGMARPGQVAPSRPGLPGGFSGSQSRSYSMQVDPDGVKVEVSQDVDGKQETQTYTAKTLDELYAAHPELRGQLGVHVDAQTAPGFGSFGLRGGGNDPFGGARGLQRDDENRPAIPLQPGAMRTDVLGVQISVPSDEDRTQAKVDDGVGLKVENVQPGTIAAKIGVQRGDLVVDVNGRVVKSVDDVRDALRSRKEGEDVAVTVVDDNGQKRVLTWRASSERRL